MSISHPINKPLILHCPSSDSWLHRYNLLFIHSILFFSLVFRGQPINQYVLPNNSLHIPSFQFNENSSQYQCGFKQYQIQFYGKSTSLFFSSIYLILSDKPSPIQAKIHYTTSSEIGLKLHYPSNIIENVIIRYKTKQNAQLHEIHLSPPSLNIRLTNLSCGNAYEIIISAMNQIGSSLNEYLIGQTDGSLPSLVQSTDLIEAISHDSIILTMSNWMINQCAILGYDIEIFPLKTSNETHQHRSYSLKNNFQTIKIDHLQPNEDYQLNLKLYSQAGETMRILSFRTTNDLQQMNSKSKNPFLILIIIIVSFILTLISGIIIFILIKFCRLHFKDAGKCKHSKEKTKNRSISLADLFIGQTRKLKPVILSSYTDHYHQTWLKSNNEFTVQNYSNRPYSYTSGKTNDCLFD